MTSAWRQMLTCHWSARRIQRYLDADPSAPLTSREVVGLEKHLATCARCNRVVRQHRGLHRALSSWSGGTAGHPAAVERLRGVLAQLTEQERP